MSMLKVLAPGMGAAWQGTGGRGLRGFGVPPGGPMDEHAAAWANRLVGNDPMAPVLEMLWGGQRVEVSQDVYIAITGAPVKTSLPLWRAVPVKAGKVIEFAPGTSGVWIYVASSGGLKTGTTPWREIRDYNSPPALRVWNGPQRVWFSNGVFEQEWKVTPQSNRVGYRLAGEPLKFEKRELLSEPVRVGTIQVPENGLPIVTMRDGPTVGGYPKLGMVDSADLSWLAQCRPGQQIRFIPLNR
jgi:allophanate hydrolase subunit 2